MKKKETFLDYIFGGCEVNLHLNIDFTESNTWKGNNYHWYRPNYHNENEYQKTIRAIGSILEMYDDDQLFPLYGYGAKLPSTDDRFYSDCFALNGDMIKPEVVGVEGILKTYVKAVPYLRMWGPTFFAPCLRKMLAYQKHKLSVESSVKTEDEMKQAYEIMLILTDGKMEDLDATIDVIVELSEYPVSIIIIGIGKSKFELMHHLDADESPLFSKALNKYAKRDIVQFVPFYKFERNGTLLAREVLKEIPEQMVGYFQTHKIQPGEPMDF